MQDHKTSSATSDPGFRLPDQAAPAAAGSGASARAPDGSAQGVEIVPGAAPGPGDAAQRDTAGRDLAIGGAAFLVLLVIYFFARNAYVHQLVVKRVAPATAGSAGWLMFVGLGFVSLAAVLAVVNAARYLSLAITGPLVVIGVAALVAALLVGRR